MYYVHIWHHALLYIWYMYDVISMYLYTSLYILYTYIVEKAMAPHSSTLAWKTPWTEEPGGLQSMGSRRVGHDWATSLHLQVIPIYLSFTMYYLFFYCNFILTCEMWTAAPDPQPHPETQIRSSVGSTWQNSNNNHRQHPRFLSSCSSFRKVGAGSQMSFLHINNGLSRHFLSEQGRLFCLVTSNMEKPGVSLIPALFQ